MNEVFRSRDVVVFVKGSAFTPAATPSFLASGWPGGRGTRWVDATIDDFVVEGTDGDRGAGFTLWGSNEDSDQFTAMTNQQVTYGYVVICFGTWLFATRTYEKYTWASRQIPPLVEITYTESEPLYWSLRGYWTNEDEWTLSGDPRAPNTNNVGYCSQAPIDGFLTVQSSL